MALIHQRICDHLDVHENERVDATEKVYTFNGRTVRVDQCLICAQQYQDIFDGLLLIGRIDAEPKPKRIKKWKSTNPDLPREFKCEFCDNAEYTTLGRLAPHVARQHKDKNTAWRIKVGLDPSRVA